MTDQQPDRPAHGWEVGRPAGPLPDPRRADLVKEPPNEPVPAVDVGGSLDRPVDAGDPVDPFDPAVLKR